MLCDVCVLQRQSLTDKEKHTSQVTENQLTKTNLSNALASQQLGCMFFLLYG